MATKIEYRKLVRQGKPTYVKDPEKGQIYKIFKVNISDDELDEVDEQYIKDFKAYEKWNDLPYDKKDYSKQVYKPRHPFSAQVVRMGTTDDEIIYYQHVNGIRDEDGEVSEDFKANVWPVQHFMPVDKKDIVRLLEMRIKPQGGKRWDNELEEYNPDENPILTYEEGEELEGLEENQFGGWRSGIPLYMYAKNAALKKFVDATVDIQLREFEHDNPDQRSSMHDKYYHTEFTKFLMAQDFAADYEKLKAEVETERQNLLAAQVKDCPKIPMIKFKLFPHQAKSLAILDRTNTGIVDVEMGGGKTLIMTCDALNMINKGRCKRPAIVMPTSTVEQQERELKKYVAPNDLNVIPLTNETWREALKKAQVPGNIKDKKKADEIREEKKADEIREEKTKEFFKNLIKTAPPNTIVLVAYTWLSKYKTEVDEDDPNDEGIKIFWRGKWLRDECGIDYVALDESHRIKNDSSNIYKATQDLASVPIRRICTGTLTPNDPLDTWGQVSFLDPTLFGTKDEFRAAYAEHSFKEKGKVKVLKWRDGGQKEMRERLTLLGYANARRSHWLHHLPTREETVHKVVLSPQQQEYYELIFNEIMEELEQGLEEDDKSGDLKANKKLKNDWKKFQEEDGDEDEEVDFTKIIKKLARLDMFLTSPESFDYERSKHDPLGPVDKNGKHIGRVVTVGGQKHMLKFTGNNHISPKVKVVDEILEQHFANPKNLKVIIFCRNKVSARHFTRYLKMKDACIYGEASNKDQVLKEFETNPKVKILCAVDGAYREGLNLQYANRVIRADVHWTPGEMEQSYARVFRPGSAAHKVYIDILVTDNTAEVTKYGRMASKAHTNAQLISDYTDDKNFHVLRMSLDNIKHFRHFDPDPSTNNPGLLPYIQKMEEIGNFEIQANKKYRETYGDKMLDEYTKPKEVLKGSKKIVTPTLQKEEEVEAAEEEAKTEADGKAPEKVTSEKTVILYYRNLKDEGASGEKNHLIGISAPDAESFNVKILKNLKWKLSKDYKPALWYRWCSSSASVNKQIDLLKDEGIDLKVVKVKGPISKALVKTDKKGEPVKVEQVTPETEEANLIELELVNMASFFYLRVPKDNENAKDLKALKFKWHGRLYWYKIKSRAAALNTLKMMLQKGYKIPDIKELVDEIKTNRIIPGNAPPKGILEQMDLKPSKTPKGIIELRYASLDGVPFLYAVEKTAKDHLPFLKKMQFKVERTYYWRNMSTKGGDKSKIVPFIKKLITMGYKATNYTDLENGLKRWKIPMKGLEALDANGATKKSASVTSLVKRIEAAVRDGLPIKEEHLSKLERAFGVGRYATLRRTE